MEREYDLGQVIHLTHQKTKHIIERDGFAVTGFVLTNEAGEKCIVDMSAVRWMARDEFFKMMHPDATGGAADARSSVGGSPNIGALSTEQEKRRRDMEYAICRHAIGILCEMCGASPEKTIDLLTDYLWEEDEAAGIKAARA